jgi:OOP family OmpA-OmpF porin
MRPTLSRFAVPIACVLAFASAPESRADEGKFDAQVFRPSGAPRDLMVVQKTEIIGHMSPTFAVHSDMALDPLVLVHNVSGQDIRAVGARLNVSGAVGIGLYDIADLQLVVPFVAWQDSDNQRPLGVEGEIDTYSVGDVRLSGRVSLGFISLFKRLSEDKGFAMAVRGDLNLPTGSVDAFTSDGALTGGGAVLADYRLPTGGVISANLGIWMRPEREFAGARIGDMASFGLAAESYVKRTWGLSVLGGAYGYPSLHKFPESPRQIPMEGFLAVRQQSSYGVTYTFGGSFGTACGFGKPAVRLFGGVTWTPATSAEQEAIDRILRRDDLDPDGDGVITEQDQCPDAAGPLENRGCPDTDGDGDGWVDRVDECPSLSGGERGQKGCPPAYIRGDEIVILEKVHFATDSHEVLPESLPILEDVARVLQGHPEVQRVNIEGHTDIRAGDEYNLALSQRRVNSVTAFMIGKGVDPRRVEAKGYGHMRPLVDDTHCNAPDQELGPECKFLTSQNRRVVFRIAHRCPALGNGVEGGPLCPIARLEGDQITTLDHVVFDAESEVMTVESRPLLNDVAKLLAEHPEIEKVRVEGHTNIHQGEDRDRRLSRKRAEVIEDYLVEQGVDAGRLESVGYGHRRPEYDDGLCMMPEAVDSSYCQFVTYKNQRFTFRILRWGVRTLGAKQGPSTR